MIVSDQLSQIITTLLKPIAFASKDNFAHLHTLKNLEDLALTLCRRAAALPLSGSDAGDIKKLQNIFEGFDGLATEEKKARIKKALDLIDKTEGKAAGLRLKADEGQQESRAGIHKSAAGASLPQLQRLATPLSRVKGIGPKLAEVFKKKGLESVEDSLYFLPVRYEDRRHIKKIAQLSPGTRDVTVGRVMALGEIFYGRRKIFEISLSDGKGFLRLKWFHYKLPLMKKRFSVGQRLVVYGEIRAFGGQKEIIHPDVEIMEEGDELDSINFNSIVPVYSQVGNLHQKTLRKIMRAIVEEYAPHAAGAVPGSILKRHGLLLLPAAIMEVHKPDGERMPVPNSAAWIPQKSIVFDELFSLELGLALKRKNLGREDGISFDIASMLDIKLRAMLPFKLTAAQERVVSEIRKDMAAPHPMNRLVQGDVGCGKTVVALMACLIAIDNHYQAAIMAPTELLAEQHYRNMAAYAGGLGIKTALLTGGLPKSERAAILNGLKSGDISLVVGTHALIQEDVEIKRLGLVIVDEQHHFGVIQRAMLKKKGARDENIPAPDVLVMTATPIPRTLSMTVFGDLDVSVIDELPPGRRPVMTKVFREKDRQGVYKILRDEINKGRQAYIVYPLIEESEELDLKDATKMAGQLQTDIFPEYKIGLLHGRMKADEKEGAMSAFKKGGTNALVSTTVIEVGIDVPNATVMVIEHAERFGLSQLHQLRGRVGRGGHNSYCILLAGRIGSEDTYKRLKVMEETNDGFRIAEEDLKLRGCGDFLGTRQSGMPDFRVANLLSDATILQKAKDEAFALIDSDPGLVKPEHAALNEIIRARWKGRMELATIG